ncbi:MAG: hypothetical protein RH862_13720 [Leptospiraceae bacterium]
MRIRRKIKTYLRFIRARFNRSLGALLSILALAAWAAGWIPGLHAFVLICVSIAIFLYRKPPEQDLGLDMQKKEPEPVVVAQSANYALIQIWAESLHDEGIPTETRDEFIGSILSQPGRSYSEIKLLVPPVFEKRARLILQEGNS